MAIPPLDVAGPRSHRPPGEVRRTSAGGPWRAILKSKKKKIGPMPEALFFVLGQGVKQKTPRVTF